MGIEWWKMHYRLLFAVFLEFVEERLVEFVFLRRGKILKLSLEFSVYASFSQETHDVVIHVLK